MLISATALLFLFPPASAAGKTASVNPTARFMSTMKGFTGNAMPYAISQKNDRDRQAIYLPIIIRENLHHIQAYIAWRLMRLPLLK